MKRGLLSTTGLVIGLALFAVINLFAGTAVRAARIDLTEGKLYTLSKGTKSILSKLDQKIKLRYYYSKGVVESTPDVAPIADFAKRVRELLEEYVALSGGQLSLEIIDPAPFSEEEDDAVAYGLTSPAVNAAGDKLFFGLVATNSVDDQRIIHFFDQSREQFLEYDLSEVISGLARIEKPVVGILSGLPVNGRFVSPNQPPEPPWFAIEQLGRGYETRELPPDSTKEIPADVKVLVVIHPKNFSQELLYAIDQFALKGGKVVAFVDPNCFFDQDVPPGGNPMMAQKDSNLQPLFDAWGIELVERKIAADREQATPIPFENQALDWIVFLGLTGESFSQDDVVTGDLKLVRLLTPGILKKKDSGTTTVEPLMQTTDQSQEVDSFSVQFGPNPRDLLDRFVPDNTRLMLAARVSGACKSAFPEGKPAAAPTPEGEPPAPPAESGPQVQETTNLNVIVVADADLLRDDLWVKKMNFFGQTVAQVSADNGSFLMNAVENMTGDEDLISLRSRGLSQRPFLKKKELEQKADEHFRAREQELEERLREAEQRLADLQQKKSPDEELILSPEQEAEIRKFEEERAETRKDLRKVRHDLRKDIDSLGRWLKFVNIALIPVVIAAAGLAWLGSQRMLRRKSS